MSIAREDEEAGLPAEGALSKTVKIISVGRGARSDMALAMMLTATEDGRVPEIMKELKEEREKFFREATEGASDRFYAVKGMRNKAGGIDPLCYDQVSEDPYRLSMSTGQSSNAELSTKHLMNGQLERRLPDDASLGPIDFCVDGFPVLTITSAGDGKFPQEEPKRQFAPFPTTMPCNDPSLLEALGLSQKEKLAIQKVGFPSMLNNTNFLRTDGPWYQPFTIIHPERPTKTQAKRLKREAKKPTKSGQNYLKIGKR